MFFFLLLFICLLLWAPFEFEDSFLFQLWVIYLHLSSLWYFFCFLVKLSTVDKNLLFFFSCFSQVFHLFVFPVSFGDLWFVICSTDFYLKVLRLISKRISKLYCFFITYCCMNTKPWISLKILNFCFCFLICSLNYLFILGGQFCFAYQVLFFQVSHSLAIFHCHPSPHPTPQIRIVIGNSVFVAGLFDCQAPLEC